MNSSSFDSFLTTNPFQSLRSLRWWWWLLTECWRLLAPSSPISRWRRRWTTRRGTWRASVSALANRKNWKKYSYISIYTYIYIYIYWKGLLYTLSIVPHLTSLDYTQAAFHAIVLDNKTNKCLCAINDYRWSFSCNLCRACHTPQACTEVI